MHLAAPLVLGFALATATGSTLAQSFPVKPIRMVAAPLGGGVDLIARLISPALAASLGQPLVVDNRPGIVAIETVAKAVPDGHTLLFYGPAIWLLPFIRDNVPWDTLRDFAPITLTVSQPNILVVHPSLPVKSVQELIALARSRPGELNYASAGSGSTNHLAAELFKSMAKLDIVRIAYKGQGPATTSLIAGEAHLMFATAGSALPLVKIGRLKALGVTSAKPTALAPGMPTLSASGLPGYESGSLLGIFAPAGTPPAVINRLNQEVVKQLNRPEIKEKLFASGMEVVGNSPDAFAAIVKQEVQRWGKVIKEAGIREN